MSSWWYSFINGEDWWEEALLYIYSSEYASSSLLVRCFKN
jgi:hypothetical protein